MVPGRDHRHLRHFSWCCALLCLTSSVCAAPRLDSSTLLRGVLVPSDAAVGKAIYRLRATDSSYDFPLKFKVEGSSVVDAQGLPCSRLNSVCQANVMLRRRLEPGRYYDFLVEVRNGKGQTVTTNCSFVATNATTPIEKIFPGAPALLRVSEASTRNAELGAIIARGLPGGARAALLELWGPPQFGLRQRATGNDARDAEGVIVLLSPLDYESAPMHHLTVMVNDPWTNPDEDTRNIASWPLLVAVLDEQDTPPIFTIAPPTTTLSKNLKPGDEILRVHAEDGDKGNPREIRYSLVPNSDPNASLFNISDETGELFLAKPLSEVLAHSRGSTQPLLLSVVAEEVRSNPQEPPAQTTTVQLALIPPGVTAGVPTFGAIEYNTLLDENPPTGTALDLPQAEIGTEAGDVVTLSLENNNGTFDISPSVVEGYSKFIVTVHDNKLLDYEKRHSVECFIVAKEFGGGNFTATAKLTVLLRDVNDNLPQFTKPMFQGSIQENSKAGSTVLMVEAVDADSEPGNKIRYTKLTGEGSHLFNLDPETGLITVADGEGLDAEKYPVITLNVEAKDEDGKGLTATSAVVITLIDVNDQTPRFEKDVYEFILTPNRTGFTSQAFVKATDNDVSPPNNEVHYEIVSPIDSLFLNEMSGELLVRKIWDSDDVLEVKVRAWDGGFPTLYSESILKIYPPEGKSIKMSLVVPGRNQDDITRTLRVVTGADNIKIHEIRPYSGYEPGATYVNKDDEGERSVVVVTLDYSKDSVVDLNRIQQLLDQNSVVRVKEREETKITRTDSSSLWWLLILFIILVIIAAIILIFCCICKACPLYIPPKRRKSKSPPMTEKLIVKGSGNGRDSKSVQVAEWFGRREAWSPHRPPPLQPMQPMVDAETESLRRHEVERGSERGERTRPRPLHRDETREQLYIREGNADILRLITRGGEAQRPIHVVEQQYTMADSGKDILMRRFIDQQQAETTARNQVLLPNAVTSLQREHELLEASLRQQNALLRQIILDRERDLKLETQSLPAGTQTDQDAGTQTEPQFFTRPRRAVRSDNDASDASDGGGADYDIKSARNRARRRLGRHGAGHRPIKTPIQEEAELEIVGKSQKELPRETKGPKIRHTKTSELRQKRASSETRSTTRSRSSRSGIKKEVLKEISASLEQSDDSDNSYYEKSTQKVSPSGAYSEDSLEEISPRSEKTTDSGRPRYHSESDLRIISSRRTSSESRAKEVLSQSHMDLTKIKPKKIKAKRTSRYMEWYDKTKNKGQADTKDSVEKTENDVSKQKKVATRESTISNSLLKETESSSRKKVEPKKTTGPEHPLLQHSERRYELHYQQPIRRPEEDTDSGIVLAKPEVAQKKSIFTIAYNGMHTNQLRPDSSTPP